MTKDSIFIIVTYVIPIVSLALQFYSEFKITKEKQAIEYTLFQNNINLETNNGTININQINNTAIEEKAEKYNEHVKNSIFLSEILFIISRYFILAIIFTNFIVNISDKHEYILSVEALLGPDSKASRFIQTILETVPHTFKQVYSLFTIYCIGIVISLVLRKIQSYQIKNLSIGYYIFLSILYFLTSTINPEITLQAITKFFNSQINAPFFYLIWGFITFIIIPYFMAPTLIDRNFNLIKNDKIKSRYENNLINFKDNFLVLLTPIILLTIHYFSLQILNK